MLAYGYELNDEDKLCSMKEVTLLCNTSELDSLIDFLKSVRSKIQDLEEVDGLHSHYRDFAKDWNENQADFILYLTNEKK